METATAGSSFHIGVLLGAGPVLSSRTKSALLQLIHDIFTEANNYVKNADRDALDHDKFLLNLTERLVVLMEDSPFTNAGQGSELTMDGAVECDATMMLGGAEGEEVSASVGATPELEHPVSLCRILIDQQLKIKSNSPLAIPNFLVGNGARDYGIRLGLCRGNLMTERARESHKKWKQRFDAEQASFDPEQSIDKYTDTVGIIIVSGGRTCIASSSGGSLLKDSGRVGPAALAGKGLDIGFRSAAVCSGFGEDINSMRLASKIVSSDDELISLTHGLAQNKIKLQRPPPYIGMLRCSTVSDDSAFFEWYHTTPSMTLGFGCVSGSHEVKPKIIHSSRPEGGGFKSGIS